MTYPGFEWQRPHQKLKLCRACGRSFYTILGARHHRHRFAGLARRLYCGAECARLGALASKHNSRARRVGVGGRISAEDWTKVCQAHEWRCAGCGRGGLALTIDHIAPLSRGGLNVLANIQPLCLPCNQKKHASIEEPQ
jgi:5-methylcytosine-specific restriction endonuclease McrA